MASINYKVGIQCTSDQSGSLNGYDLEGGATESSIDTTFPANSTNATVTLAFVQANVQALILVSDKGCTFKTNNSTSPQDTIVLKPGIPLVWCKSPGYFNCPFVGNVTTAFVTTTVGARLQGKILSS